MEGLVPRYTWRLRPSAPIPAALADAGRTSGLSERLVSLLASRGVSGPADLRSWLGDPAAALHDPALLPGAEAFRQRVEDARRSGERVLVLGDFDADGLTGLSILTLALRHLGLDASTYVPDREEGHGLSAAAIARARTEGRTLILTADCGTSSVDEIRAASAAGIDVLVTDHHRPPPELPAARAIVNPMLLESAYPDPRLSGAGVAFKCAQLLIGARALEFADLAAIGTIADVAPLAGENRAICRLGLERLRTAPRPGLAALLEASRLDAGRISPETLAFAVIPRLNAVGRVGDAARAAQLLLAQSGDEAAALAAELDAANVIRRELLATALAEARDAVDAAPGQPVIVVAGAWPPGIIGLVAGRLAEEHGRPAVVFCNTSEPWRGSARSAGFDIVAALASMAELFERYGGHSAAAGCHMSGVRFAEFRSRMHDAGRHLRPVEPTLDLDLVVDAAEIDYRLLRELAELEPSGAGNPLPLVGVRGLKIGRVRAANGGHTQLVLRKGMEVLDGICFGRDDLPGALGEGEFVDIVARLDSRRFGGYESLQLDVRDLGPPGTLATLAQAGAAEPVAA